MFALHTYSISSKAAQELNYLGLHVTQKGDFGVLIDQVAYIQSIEPLEISIGRRALKSDFCTTAESSQFRRLVGKLNWVSTQTRPDISFDVCMLSSVMKKPQVSDLILANKVLLKAKDTPLSISFPALDVQEYQLVCYSDASLANLPSGKSAGGFIVFLESSNRCCPVFWRSNSIRRVVRSTLAAETGAMVDALDTAYYISTVLQEMGLMVPIIAFTDNASLHKSAHSLTSVEEHRLQVEIAMIREMLGRGEISSISWIANSKQLADCLTKRGASSFNLTRVLEMGSFYD